MRVAAAAFVAVVASLVAPIVVPHTANAAPASRCKPARGAPIFEARWFSGKAKVVTKVFASGMWTRLATSPGPDPNEQRGCIESPTIDEIKAALAAAKWKKMKPQAHCDGISADETDFYTGGKRRFTQKLCDGFELDEKTAQLIETIGKQIPDGFARMPTPDDMIEEIDFAPPYPHPHP